MNGFFAGMVTGVMAVVFLPLIFLGLCTLRLEGEEPPTDAFWAGSIVGGILTVASVIGLIFLFRAYY